MAVCMDEKVLIPKIISDQPLGSAVNSGRRKKTKSRGADLVFTITDAERKRLEEEKGSVVELTKSTVAKAFYKIAAFSKQTKSPHETRTESCYERILPLAPSFVPISALKGSYEKKGLGPRPKLRVSWAPDVQEPTGTNVSHKLVNQMETPMRRGVQFIVSRKSS